MSCIKKYLEILAKTNDIALATSIDNIPNVRIINFCYKVENPDILYFTSDRKNQKVVEFGKNQNIAFTTIPHDDISHVRSQNAVVKKSKYSLNEVKELFIKNIPDYDETIKAIGESLDVFEIHVKGAIIITGYETPDFVKF
ncbi:MAG: pyridoxamine 5'-phosphate oxidase family protein [Elusimicrobiota bacterium]|jgi:uncharacterized pyridoxamine 5'-phosphate oxidase family protein|nr:pyridoxamine 5'-phosphate oxidase family protein [Elusimicrobiota bacterium]